MGFVADGGELFLGKGMVWIDRLDSSGVSTGYRAAGACEGFTLSLGNIDIKEKYDPTQAASPLLASVPIRQQPQVKITALQLSPENLALYTMGNATTVSVAATPIVDELIQLRGLNRGYFVSRANIPMDPATPAVVKVGSTTKTVNTDYTIDYVHGMVLIPSGSTILGTDVIKVSYTPLALTKNKVRGAMVGQILAKVAFVSDPTAGKKWDFEGWKISLQPEGELAFIGEDFVSFSLNGKILADATNHPTEPNYILEQVAA